jgi:hypothetical protein
MVYKFRTNHLNKILDPQVVGERLEYLKKSYNMLTPECVVDDSRPPEAPLHHYFEWRDDIAAEKYRNDQASHLIRTLVVVIPQTKQGEKKDIVTRAYVNIKEEEGRGYLSVDAVMSTPNLRQQLLETALHDLEIWQNKYNTLEELSSVYIAIEQGKKEVKKNYVLKHDGINGKEEVK